MGSRSCPTKPSPISSASPPELTNPFNEPLNSDQTFIAHYDYDHWSGSAETPTRKKAPVSVTASFIH